MDRVSKSFKEGMQISNEITEIILEKIDELGVDEAIKSATFAMVSMTIGARCMATIIKSSMGLFSKEGLLEHFSKIVDEDLDVLNTKMAN